MGGVEKQAVEGEVALAREWLVAVVAREEQGELIFADFLRERSLRVQRLIPLTMTRFFLLPEAQLLLKDSNLPLLLLDLTKHRVT